MAKILEFYIFMLIYGLSKAVEDLNDDGVWVPWNSFKVGMPANVIVGGDLDGTPLFVARAIHCYGDDCRGTVIGYYSPLLGSCNVPYFNEEYRYRNFELLTHTNYMWTSMEEHQQQITGGNAQFICRAYVKGVLTPGKLHRSSCWVTNGGKEYQYKIGYQVLRKKGTGDARKLKKN